MSLPDNYFVEGHTTYTALQVINYRRPPIEKRNKGLLCATESVKPATWNASYIVQTPFCTGARGHKSNC